MLNLPLIAALAASAVHTAIPGILDGVWLPTDKHAAADFAWHPSAVQFVRIGTAVRMIVLADIRAGYNVAVYDYDLVGVRWRDDGSFRLQLARADDLRRPVEYWDLALDTNGHAILTTCAASRAGLRLKRTVAPQRDAP